MSDPSQRAINLSDSDSDPFQSPPVTPGKAPAVAELDLAATSRSVPPPPKSAKPVFIDLDAVASDADSDDDDAMDDSEGSSSVEFITPHSDDESELGRVTPIKDLAKSQRLQREEESEAETQQLVDMLVNAPKKGQGAKRKLERTDTVRKLDFQPPPKKPKVEPLSDREIARGYLGTKVHSFRMSAKVRRELLKDFNDCPRRCTSLAHHVTVCLDDQ